VSEPTLAFHGAAGTVTGSCYELRSGDVSLLVDCGLFQGPRSLEALNFSGFAFAPGTLDALVLTHAHLDHSGLLPRLVAHGFGGPIWCTPATAQLLPHLLRDSARLMEQDADRRNRRRDRAGEPEIEPLYLLEDVEQMLRQVRTVHLGKQFTPCDGVQARLWNAGHVLGSASVELEASGVRLLFSGDLGSASSGLLDDPEGPAGVDHLIAEATYGDRERPSVSVEERRDELKREVRQALARGGNLLIPAFALERTQELLLDLATLINRGELPHASIFIDSPLATRVTSVFAARPHDLDGVDVDQVFRHPAFHYVEDVAQSRALENMSGAIIIAGSGMCEGGRIRHHLLGNLPRSDSTLLFVGYQAAGALGRTILEGARRVRVSGEDVNVRLHVREIGSYSAHADRRELLAWIQARQPVAGTIFLTHGEAAALKSLHDALDRQTGAVRVPELGEAYAVPAGSPARRIKAGRPDLRDVLSRDWQNDYADLAVNLKKELARIEDQKRRREAIARMRAVLESYRDSRTDRHR
jgi:metallo-beta-lactamase family protein